MPASSSAPSSTGSSSSWLGFHKVGTASHVGKLPAAQAAELMERRGHGSLNKIKALPHTTSDAPKVLASAPGLPPCVSCAEARITRASHSGTLSASDGPGKVHLDLKEFILSIGGYRYVVFMID